MEPNGSMYRVNNMGAKMEPWGTPQVIGAEEENKFPIFQGVILDTNQVFETVQENCRVSCIKGGAEGE